MDLRLIIAANLEALKQWHIDRGNDLTSARAIARRAKVSKNTVVQLLDPEKAERERYPAVDTLQAIAEAFDLQAWQLLIPDLDPADPPTIPVTGAERALNERLKTLVAREIAARLGAAHGRTAGADRGPNPHSQVPAARKSGPKATKARRQKAKT